LTTLFGAPLSLRARGIQAVARRETSEELHRLF